ncbi:helix-turn-helix transcriptional regulator [Pendulispora brunnea]|uniref:Helix-turn-helix transcriptional regulator n=1 Tax=Pendulispora brunnea TaxID=2905690 RepID=A0ABZ2K9A1_9BACT
MATDRRSELADFLRGRRTRASPLANGLPAGRRRRTPGLRREELAQLAGLSVDWYTRLEQGRDVNPSRETLQAIARVLDLDDDERGHLFYLARPEQVAPQPASTRQEKAEPAMLHALSAMTAPAFVMSPRFDVLAWNAGACRVLIPFDAVPRERRNILWLTFHHAEMGERYVDVPTMQRDVVASFRLSASSFVGDPHFDALITELLETSEAFRMIWARHEVRAKTRGTKTFRTRGAPLVLQWFGLNSPTTTKQMLVYYVARPGEEHRLAEL